MNQQTCKIFAFCLLLICCFAAGACAKESGGAGFIALAQDDPTLPGSQGNMLSLDDDDEYLDSTSAHTTIYDPLESWNRFWFNFNDVAVEYVGRPLYKGYSFVVPSPVRTGVSNLFYNAKMPVRFTNALLQGKGQQAGVEFSSFILNVMMGAGVYDYAKDAKKVVEPSREDGGQTLGYWGMGEGVYIVWPVLGPSNVRDTLGMGMDWFMNPRTYLVDSWELNLGISAFEVFNSFDSVLDTYDTLKGMAVEPYAAVRDGYTQYRRAQIEK